MAIVTFFDTETTGLLPKYYKMSDISKLPYMVQLGAIMVDIDDNFKELGQIDALVKPEGFIIPEEATAIHGIVHDYAVSHGSDLYDVVKAFDDFANNSVGFVAHNIDYDSKIMALSYARSGFDSDLIWSKPKKCTMRAATPVCNLPGKFGPKWPKLAEAYKMFFDEEIIGAHDAIVDIRATIRVFRYLRSISAI